MQPALALGAEMGDDDEGEARAVRRPRKKPSSASMPPAEAPMPTMGKARGGVMACFVGEVCGTLLVYAFACPGPGPHQPLPLEQPQAGPYHLARGIEPAGGDLRLDELAEVLGKGDAQPVFARHGSSSASGGGMDHTFIFTICYRCCA